MSINWSEEDYEMFKVVEPDLVLFDKDGEEDPEWFYQFLHCTFKKTDWDAKALVESIKKDKEEDFVVEQVFTKYCD